MENSLTCADCGADIPTRTTICPVCGWDLGTAIQTPARRSLARQFLAGGWRVLLYGALIVLPILGFARLRTTGPGPDLPTTLKWMAFGDDGHAAELVTIHRAYEIGAAASRYAVRELEPFGFGDGWAEELAPKATMNVRGWIPLLFFGADTDRAPASVREIYEIRDTDGWGRAYRVTSRTIPAGDGWRDDPVIAVDLAAGLQARFHTLDEPDLGTGEWQRIELVSAGRDGVFESGDDIRFVSFSLVSAPLRMLADPGLVVKEIERNYTIGPQYFRIEGSSYDLVDARILAEYRLTSLY